MYMYAEIKSQQMHVICDRALISDCVLGVDPPCTAHRCQLCIDIYSQKSVALDNSQPGL